jgi:hypothetical protein
MRFDRRAFAYRAARLRVAVAVTAACVVTLACHGAEDPIRAEARARYEAFLCSDTMRACLDLSETACSDSISKATESCSIRRLSEAVSADDELTAASILEMHDASAELGLCISRRFGETLGYEAGGHLTCVPGTDAGSIR